MRMRTKVKTQYIIDETDGKFVSWVATRMNELDYKAIDLSKKIGCSKQAIWLLLRQNHKPQKQTVIALCWAFGMQDDPEDIWKLVEEDWA